MAKYKLLLNLAKSSGKVRAGISAHLEGVGATATDHDLLKADDEAVPGDVGAVLQDIKKKNTCAILWRPKDEAPRFTTIFRDAMAAKEAFDQFIVMISIEGYPEERGYLKGATVKSVAVDPRMGAEVVKLECTSVEVKRA
jgi:hypothetical protein